MLHTHPKVVQKTCTDPVAANGGEDQRVSLLTVPVELDAKERLAVVLLERPRGRQQKPELKRREAAWTYPQAVDTLERVSALL